ncbi:MAG TPA: ABC transporter permease [Candidatus Saccharimonadales bacterium]|nr:ABC transporter permease [Candidatus Saccharimonadales bacterium]
MVRTLRLLFQRIGAITLLFSESVRSLFARPFEGDAIMEQLYSVGVRSLSIATITGVFSGMVLALETAYTLAIYGARMLTGKAVALSMVQELGPVLTGLVVAGRVGAGITAELGTMAVTEQVDAIRALGADPVKKLVMPRVVATFIMLPALTILSDFLGILGGMVISMSEVGQTSSYYLNQVISTLQFREVITGTGKTPFFALIIALVACYNGIHATGGADGVGRATTRTVVTASVLILISNFFLTKFFYIVL